MAFSLVSFEVTVGVPVPGCVVAVVGDHPALGCWDPAKSVPLFASPNLGGGPQVHTSTPVSVPSYAAVQYKYVVLSHGQLQRWEDIQGNRSLVPDRPDVTVRDELDCSSGPPLPVVGAEPLLPPLPASVPPMTLAESSRTSHASDDGNGHESSVLVVSYILPLVITKKAAAAAAEGGVGSDEDAGSGWSIAWNPDSITSKKRPLSEHTRVQWIGCPGITVAEEDRASLTAALTEYNCVPIFLDAELVQHFYFGFCRSYLWPTLHNVIKARSFYDKVWRAYCTANRKFADKVIEVYDSADLVWVHDYHLLLLPSYILRKLRTARVGLFLHTPFPSSEIFRTIPVRDELLRGMLNADLIGFHIFEYARRLVNAHHDAFHDRALSPPPPWQVRSPLPHVLQADAGARV